MCTIRCSEDRNYFVCGNYRIADCATVDSSGGWQNEDCRAEHPFVCTDKYIRECPDLMTIESDDGMMPQVLAASLMIALSVLTVAF